MTEDRGREQLHYAACRLQDANVDNWILSVPLWFVAHSLATFLEPCGAETLCGIVSSAGGAFDTIHTLNSTGGYAQVQTTDI